MKRSFLSLGACICLSTILLAQAPEAFNYQGVARNASGDAITNQSVGVQFQLHQATAGGTVVYAETHAPTTDDLGLFAVEVGNGTPGTGTFAGIDWSAGPYFLEVGLDPAGGTAYVSVGTQQLLSVPFALHAETAESAVNDQVDDADPDPTNEIQTISRTSTTVTLSDGGGTFQDSVGVYTAGNNIDISGNTIDQVTNMHPFNTINFMICVSGDYPLQGNTGFFNPTLGEIRMFAGTFAPTNWAFCDGQLLPILPNSALFSILGTLYGGDGTTTFALPDLRGRSLLHEGTGPGLSQRNLGQPNGVE